METDTKTYTVVFKDGIKKTDLGLRASLAYCEEYIHKNNRDHNIHDLFLFQLYKGGTVTIMCNETGEDYYITPVF